MIFIYISFIDIFNYLVLILKHSKINGENHLISIMILYKQKYETVIKELYNYRIIDAESEFIKHFGNIFPTFTRTGQIIEFDSPNKSVGISSSRKTKFSASLKRKLASLKKKYQNSESITDKDFYILLENFDSDWFNTNNIIEIDKDVYQLKVWGIKKKYLKETYHEEPKQKIKPTPKLQPEVKDIPIDKDIAINKEENKDTIPSEEKSDKKELNESLGKTGFISGDIFYSKSSETKFIQLDNEKFKSGYPILSGNAFKIGFDGFMEINSINKTSNIKLYPNSYLTFPKDDTNSRELNKLIFERGDLFAIVDSDKSKDYKLTIETPCSIVSVIGTSFFLSINDKVEMLYCFNGIVSIENRSSGTTKVLEQKHKIYSDKDGNIDSSSISENDIKKFDSMDYGPYIDKSDYVDAGIIEENVDTRETSILEDVKSTLSITSRYGNVDFYINSEKVHSGIKLYRKYPTGSKIKLEIKKIGYFPLSKTITLNDDTSLSPILTKKGKDRSRFANWAFWLFIFSLILWAYSFSAGYRDSSPTLLAGIGCSILSFIFSIVGLTSRKIALSVVSLIFSILMTIALASTLISHNTQRVYQNMWSCDDDYFRCDDGECIPWDYYCDAYQDCSDGSDEWNCNAY